MSTAGILPPPRRTAAGYRVYRGDTLSILTFVTRARRLGFRLDEIKEVVQIRRSGRCPCPHVLDLVRERVGEDADFRSYSDPHGQRGATRPRSAITSSG